MSRCPDRCPSFHRLVTGPEIFLRLPHSSRPYSIHLDDESSRISAHAEAVSAQPNRRAMYWKKAESSGSSVDGKSPKVCLQKILPATGTLIGRRLPIRRRRPILLRDGKIIGSD